MTLTVTEMTYNLLFVFITLYLTYLQDFVNAKGIIRYHHLSDDLMNRTEADSACKTLGEDWGLPSDVTKSDHQMLSTEIARRGWSSMWLSQQRLNLPQWTWINDSFYSGPLGVSANCAYIDTNDKVVREADCVASKKKGYICKLKEKCPDGILSHTTLCLQKDSHSYILGCNVHSWYDARYICTSLGGDLLSETPSLEFDYNHWCRDIWIGLRKEKCLHFYPKEKKEEVMEAFWENSGSKGFGAVLAQSKESKNKYRWRISGFNEEHHFICQNYDKSLTSGFPGKETESTDPTVNKPLVDKENRLRVAVISLTLVLVLCLVLIAVLLYLLHRFKHNKRTSIINATSVSPLKEEAPKLTISEYGKVDQSKFSTPDIPALYATSEDVTQNEPTERYTGAATASRNKKGSLKSVKPKTKPPPPPKMDPSLVHLYAVPDVNRKSMSKAPGTGTDETLIVVENDVYSEPLEE